VGTGTIGDCGNNTSGTSPNVLWQSDTAASGASQAGTAWADVSIRPSAQRSTAFLQLPDGATVTHAFLYWAATIALPDNNGRLVAFVDGTGNAATIEGPGDGADSPVPADVTLPGGYGDSNTVLGYQSRADVTQFVHDHGAGAYRVGGFDTVNPVNIYSDDRFMGWWMVVLYEAPNEPLRNIALYDGFDSVRNGNPVNTTLSGFHIPGAGQGAVSGKLGVVAWEGDNSINGDSLLFNGALLANYNDPNATTNFFNSGHSYLGSPISMHGDLPQFTGDPGSMSGIDLHVVDVSNKLHPDDISATLQASTAPVNPDPANPDSPSNYSDSYVLGGFVLSTEVVAPDFTTSTKTFADVAARAGGAILPGDTLTYTIVVPNTGTVDSKNTVLTDVLPNGVTYVPHTIAVDGAAKTDDVDIDQAEFVANTVTVRLGTGADATNGGIITVGASTTVTFQVTVNSDAKGSTISNQATISANGATDPDGTLPVDTPTTSDPATPGLPTDTPPVDECSDNSQCSAPTPVCQTSMHPYTCVECAHNSDCVGNAAGPSCHQDTHTCGQPQSCNQDSDCGDVNSGSVCDDTTKMCEDGCRGEGGNGCPGGEVCSSTTAAIGTCGPGGQPCTQDSDCGEANSGRVCSDTTKTCENGCRGVGGNHCPSEQVCSSATAEVGDCKPGQPCDPANHDTDCGDVNSGRVCNSTLQVPVCQDGCRGQGGNGCAGGEACSSLTTDIGTCGIGGSVERGVGDIRGSGNGIFNCAAGPESSDANSTLWAAGAVAAVMVASRRRKKGERSERV